MHPQAVDFMRIFEGFTDAYGTYKITDERRDDGKVLGKAYSINRKVTVELWHEHLMGKQGLGIIPINGESLCRFGAIDIDEYPSNLLALNKNIVDNNLPLVTIRTKSGGIHLYLFTSEMVEAKLLQMKLRELAGFLGYGHCEIYPRQVQLLVERGDAGNWINMPYFDSNNTMRYALNREHVAMNAEQFVNHVGLVNLSRKQLEEIKPTSYEVLPGGPPCLQHLCKAGFPQGTRNNGLFNIGVFCIKSNPDGWEAQLDTYNNRFMQPPLSSEEVLAVIKSLKKKQYNYTCKAQPIQSYCNAPICRTCKFGIGGSDIGMPKMGTLSKLCTVPPIWFLDVETESGGGRLELLTEDLQNPMRFQNKCMEVLNIMPAILKREHWQDIIVKLLANVNVIEVPVEATPKGTLLQHLEDFCTGRAQAKTCEEILLGKPWCARGEIHFRLKDFMQYLGRLRYTDLKQNHIAMYIRDIEGYRKDFHNIKGKGANVFVIPDKTFSKQLESFSLPPQLDKDII